MSNNGKPDFDEMFRSSQQSKFPNQNHTVLTQDEQLPPHGQRDDALTREQAVNPEVLDATGHPVKPPSRVSAETLAFISIIIGVAAFVLIFVGMFLHVFMWLNILICLTGIGFGIAALLKQSSGRILGVIGVVLCVLDLVVELICMIVVAISAGVSAVFHLFT